MNEKLRGASSSNEPWPFGQARCWEKVSVSSASPSSAPPSASPSRRTSCTSATPSASRSAVSSESVSRRSRPSPHHEPVDDHLDGVLLVAGQVDLVGELVHLAVDAGPGVALGGQVGEQRLVGALAAAHDRGQHLEAGALGQLEDAVDDLLRGLAGDLRAALRAVGHADAGVEQPEVVVDLGDRADGGARVARRRLLVDRDGRRQPLDEVDVGLVHLPEELAGVGRQRLDVAALALGVDRVEGQRRLARARQPGEDDELVAGQLDADVLQVVLAGAPDDQRIGHRDQATGPAHPPNACSLTSASGARR